MVGKKCKVRWPRGLDERARFDEWGNRMKPKYPMQEVRHSCGGVICFILLQFSNLIIIFFGFFVQSDVEVWYDGIVLQYHVDKDKHRIYFTGSMQENRPPDVVYNRDWICLKHYPHRVQIQVDSEDGEEGAYCLYHVLSSDMKREHRESIELRRRERNGENVVGEVGGEAVVEYAGGDEGEADVDEEWTMHVDEESGSSYQYNNVTGESVWDVE